MARVKQVFDHFTGIIFSRINRVNFEWISRTKFYWKRRAKLVRIFHANEASEGTDNIPAKFLGQEVEDESLKVEDED